MYLRILECASERKNKEEARKDREKEQEKKGATVTLRRGYVDDFFG